MARISCRSQLILDTWRANLATNWRFSRPRPLRERMKRKSCHGSPPGNAPRHSLATTGRQGMHRGEILPLQDAGERISRAFRHESPPGNASRRNIATVSHSRMHYSYILPMKSPTAARKYSVLVSRHTASAPPSGTGSAVVGAASGIGSASADAPNHGAGASAADGHPATGLLNLNLNLNLNLPHFR